TGYAVTYDGAAHTAGGTATGVGGVTLPSSDLDLSHTTHTNAGTYNGDRWSFADPNYVPQSGTVSDRIAPATPTVRVTAAGGAYTQGPFAATAAVAGFDGTFGPGLEGVTPTLTYYAGPTATGTPLGGAPTLPGTYTVLASFAGSADYTPASATATFTITRQAPQVVGFVVNQGNPQRSAINSLTLVFDQEVTILPAVFRLTRVVLAQGQVVRRVDLFPVALAGVRFVNGQTQATLRLPVPLADGVYQLFVNRGR